MKVHETLETTDGVQLAVRRWQADEPLAAVVLVHGFTASCSDPRVEAIAVELHAMGLDVVTYDSRGHGSSGGTSTLGDLEHHDVAAAVAHARTRCDAVIVVGASMGAIAALRHAADDPALAGVVTVSCPSRWRLPRNPQGIFAAALTRTPLGRAFLARHAGVRVHQRWTAPVPPIELVRRVRAPLAVVHGERDRFISAHDAAELHHEAEGPSRLAIVPGMGHAYSAVCLPAVVSAVRWMLTLARGA
jgi:alpha-beta hydrolase superfamily lysophospholipase